MRVQGGGGSSAPGRFRRQALLVALAALLPALAWAGPEVSVFETVARVTVGVDGRPQEVQGAAELPGPLREYVESSLREWRFEPVVIDGVARTGTTWARLSVCAVPSGEGFALSSRHVANGPVPVGRAAQVKPPHYPVQALRRGLEAEVTVNYTVNTDGSATLDSVDYGDGYKKPLRQNFARGLRDWVSAMRYRPEELDGQPVATRLSTRVSFHMGTDGPATRREFEQAIIQRWKDSPECLAAEGLQPRGQLVSADSHFRLRAP
ncbi:energy transducer TonB [Luteimonas dalianensis]|uniref:energy transducer TonB n=1 Tax=Luteimonas dalianensis TaxID=1148196 RepID=UPI003BF14645